MKKIDFDKTIAKEITENKRTGKIKTETGHDVKLLKFDAKSECPIVGLVCTETDEVSCQWTDKGFRNPERLNTPSIFDLHIEVEDTHE